MQTNLKTNQRLKITFTVIALLSITILFLNLTSAVELLCLQKGQKAEFSKCNLVYNDRTCTFSSCQYCVSQISPGVYCPANINRCNSQGTSCTAPGGTPELDVTPPQITLGSPQNEEVYTSRSVFMNINLDESAEIYYLDNLNGRGRWVRLCTRCSDYSRKRSFKEGFNNITIRAKDYSGNIAYKDVSFFIDSKKPRIGKTEPRRGFASGYFRVEIREDNPSTLQLKIINGISINTLNVNIAESCFLDRRNHVCDIQTDVSPYSNQEISYSFSLIDIAGNAVESRPIFLKVDVTPPVINSIITEIDRRRLEFRINITEQNFDEVVYIDNSDSRPREKRLCSRLKNDLCERRISLREGSHDLTLIVRDEAGNSVARNLQVVI